MSQLDFLLVVRRLLMLGVRKVEHYVLILQFADLRISRHCCAVNTVVNL